MNQKDLCTFYIVRHGETEWNRKKILQGQKDSALTPKAIAKTKKLARELKKINFAAAFSSDLLRAKRTTEIIALEHKLTVQTTKLLRERTFGKGDGTDLKKFIKFFKKIAEEKEKLIKEEGSKLKLFPDMESDEEIVTRLITFLRQTALAYHGKIVLVGTHGGIMRQFLIHLDFIPYKKRNNWSITNLAYFVLQSDGVEFFIKKTKGITKKDTAWNH